LITKSDSQTYKSTIIFKKNFSFLFFSLLTDDMGTEALNFIQLHDVPVLVWVPDSLSYSKTGHTTDRYRLARHCELAQLIV